ncbi:MAG: type III PLP-dependent enzyme [Solirubrobacteraceae bacterium]
MAVENGESPRVGRFIAQADPSTPYLIVDLDVIADRYHGLRAALPESEIYYAVKANPAPEVLRVLDGLGSSFDCASIFEIEQCLAIGIDPGRLSFGNTIKKRADIAAAYCGGVDLYAFDSAAELQKLAAAAPGARVFCRILMNGDGADWPLSRKFGCEPDMARDLLLRAQDLGLQPYGLSFHVDSQQRDLTQWEAAIAQVARLFEELADHRIELELVKLGGGLPACYRSPAPSVEAHGAAIMDAMRSHFVELPRMIIEPGRGIAGDAGVIVAEVVLVSTKSYGDERRWVYLDIGTFGGLPETIGEAIKYRLSTAHDGGLDGPVVLAGPTCDSLDILYDEADYRLPLELDVGDRVLIHGAGAYTTSYCSVGFNGFPPLASYYVAGHEAGDPWLRRDQEPGLVGAAR